MPEVDKKYKCHHCTIVIPEGALVNGNCPQCGGGFAASRSASQTRTVETLIPMCPNDTIACDHDVVEGIAYCDICGEAMCPICKSHDVSQHSRITGYIQEVSGFNSGKLQELKDRTRVMNAEITELAKPEVRK